jgi:hypothetical protein
MLVGGWLTHRPGVFRERLAGPVLPPSWKAARPALLDSSGLPRGSHLASGHVSVIMPSMPAEERCAERARLADVLAQPVTDRVRQKPRIPAREKSEGEHSTDYPGAPSCARYQASRGTRL